MAIADFFYYLLFLKDSPPFPIGVFHAFSKPTSSNAFLFDLIAEAEALYEIGFLFKGKRYLVKIESFICDAPARAMILSIKGHSSELNGCTRCAGFDRYVVKSHTNLSFRDKHYACHHNCQSILENIYYLDMIKDIPLDPMHLLD